MAIRQNSSTEKAAVKAVKKAGKKPVEKAEVVVVARKAKKIVPQQDLPAKATKAIKDVSAKTGKVIDWDSPQELLDNTRNPSDLTVKAILLKTFTDAEIAEMSQSKFGERGHTTSTIYVSDRRSQINRQAHFKGTIENAQQHFGKLLPIPKYGRDDSGELFEIVLNRNANK